jgi:2-oxo-4-hydroxy-4-carboxy--5-ureidoimidazoline (OHCU) decarboxylase
MTQADRSYSVRDDVLTAYLKGEAVLLDMESRKYFRLNDTAAEIWKQLERGANHESLVEQLCTKFQVDREEARSGVMRVLADLAQKKLILRAEGADDTQPTK